MVCSGKACWRRLRSSSVTDQRVSSVSNSKIWYGLSWPWIWSITASAIFRGSRRESVIVFVYECIKGQNAGRYLCLVVLPNNGRKWFQRITDPCRGMKTRYLIAFAQSHSDFRIPELQSVSELHNFPIHLPDGPDTSRPFMVVELEDERHAFILAQRCILIK